MPHIGPYTRCGFDTPACRRDIAERSVSQIAVEDVASDACDKQVGKSIIVEIGGGGPHHVAVSVHTGVLW